MSHEPVDPQDPHAAEDAASPRDPETNPSGAETPAKDSALGRDRRALLRSLTGLGLANVSLSFLGKSAAQPRRDDGDGDDTAAACGKPNDDGSYSKDDDCNFPAGREDKDCKKPDGRNNPHSDDRCGHPEPGKPTAFSDNDCSAPIPEHEGKFMKDNDCDKPSAPGLPAKHKDGSCAKPILEPGGAMKDESCNRPVGQAPGGPVHSDQDCAQVVAGKWQADDDCGQNAGWGVYQDNDCGAVGAGVTQSDEDCGKPKAAGTHSDEDCTLSGPGMSYADGDCGNPSHTGAPYPDGPNP